MRGQELQEQVKIGALVIACIILGVPYHNYRIAGSKSLFSLLRPRYYLFGVSIVSDAKVLDCGWRRQGHTATFVVKRANLEARSLNGSGYVVAVAYY